MSYKNCIEVKVKIAEDGVNVKNRQKRAECVQSILKGQPVTINKKSPTFKKMLESVGCEVRDSWTGGCYGSRDGSSGEGYTVWLDACSMPERELDEDGDEIVNLHSLIENCGGDLMEDLEGEAFEEMCESLGHEVARNNTYNYAGHDPYTPYFLVGADFAIIEGKNAAFLSIKFHCGGDIRGNYTRKVVFEFESVEDVYSVVYPSCELKNQDS